MKESEYTVGAPRAATTYQATWQEPLPADEIARQQDMKSQLRQGVRVEILRLGEFTYAGLWDTMHSFYPAAGQDLATLLPPDERHRLRCDLTGRPYLQLPYTLLADYIERIIG